MLEEELKLLNGIETRDFYENKCPMCGGTIKQIGAYETFELEMSYSSNKYVCEKCDQKFHEFIAIRLEDNEMTECFVEIK